MARRPPQIIEGPRSPSDKPGPVDGVTLAPSKFEAAPVVEPVKKDKEGRPLRRFSCRWGNYILSMPSVTETRMRGGHMVIEEKGRQIVIPGYYETGDPEQIACIEAQKDYGIGNVLWDVDAAKKAGQERAFEQVLNQVKERPDLVTRLARTVLGEHFVLPPTPEPPQPEA